METRAAYLLVGIFVMTVFFGILGFFLWLASDDIEYKVTYYDIYFQGSVTGLTEGAKVNYSGVPVGIVKLIDLRPKKADRVYVNVAIRQDIPIHEDAVASLEMQGITGYTYVQINGGTTDAPLLKPLPGQKYPVIASKSSSVEELLTSLPKIANQMTNFLDRLNMLMDEENRESISAALENVESLTRKLDHMAEPLEKLIVTSTKTMETVDRQIDGLGSEMKVLMGNLKKSSASIDAVLEESKGSLKAFGQSGLYEFTKTVSETRSAVANLSELVQRINEGPPQFLFEKEGAGLKIPRN